MGRKYNTGRRPVTADVANGIKKSDKPRLRLEQRINAWDKLPDRGPSGGMQSQLPGKDSCWKPGSLNK